MRILIVSDVYFPRVNGVSTSIRTFRADLAALGVESLLIAPDYPGRVPAPDEEGVLRVASGAVPRDPEDRRMLWRFLTRTLNGLPGDAFDVVHVQTPFIAHYAATRFARARQLPCVATFHTFFEEYLHHYVPGLPRALGRALARGLTRSQSRDVQALISPSPAMQELLSGYGVEVPVRVLPTGLPPESFGRGDGARFRAKLGIEPRRPVLTYVGRVAHEKNIGFLLEMFVRVRRQVPDALLVVAGEGPARPSLEALATRLGIAEAVRFVGYLERSTSLLDCYAAATAFVFASRTETQGLVLLEAFAQGTPAVSTAELGTRSILQGDCGALVVPEDAHAFAAAAVRVLVEPGLRETLAARARVYAAAWSSRAMAGRLAELYREVSDAYSRQATRRENAAASLR